MNTVTHPPIDALVKVVRGTSTWLGTVASRNLHAIGGKDGFIVHAHNRNGEPCSSTLFVSDEWWTLIPH